MPKDMPLALLAAKNKLSQDGAWVWLVDLTTPDGETTYRFCNNTEDVAYGGHTYTAFSFSLQPLDYSSSGDFASFQLVITNIGFALQDEIRSSGGMCGASLTLTYVNTEMLAADYTNDQVTFGVLHCVNRYWDIIFHCGIPATLRHLVPEDEYMGLYCRHDFRLPNGEYGLRCGYTGQTISSINLPSGSPVQVNMAAAHGWNTGDDIRIFQVTGLTPELNGDYIITWVDSDSFTLNGTDGDDYAGTPSGGKAGYADCPNNFEGCIDRKRTSTFGGNGAQRANAVRLTL